MPAKPLTDVQKQDAMRLKNAYIAAKRINKNLTQEGIAYACGWKTQGAVHQYMNGLIPLNLEALLKFSAALGVAPESISPSLAKMLGKSPVHSKPISAESGEHIIDQYHEVLGAMGAGVLLRDQPGQITGWRVTSEWVNKNIPHNTGKQNLRIVTGFGDSMRGMFNSGDPLIVDIGIKSADFDGVYFFRVGNEGFIKRLQRIPGDGIRVLSENKAYEAWTIREGMDFEIFGRVLKVWRSEDF